MITYGVARHEDAEVTCRVAANPPAKRFKWTFNNTADTIDVPPGRFTSQPTYSIITYTPMTELDYGTLLCWARNDIGSQSYPCIFHIVPAGKPDPPANCSVLNQTASGFTVACQEGFDGGLKQVFMLRVARPGTMGHNLTNGHPVFQVGQLEPDATYRLQVWAANEKGVSPSVHLQAFTTHPPTHQHTAHVVAEVREGSSGGSDSNGSDGNGGEGGNGSDGSSGGLLGGNGSGGLRSLVLVVVGASAGVVLLLLLLALLVRQRVRRPSTPPNTPAKPPDSATSSASSPPPILKPASHTCSHRDMQVESENEVDPDLIPQSLAQAALSPSGPLLRPPASYGGTDPSFCEVVLAAGVGGKGGGAGAVHHHLLPTSHPLTHTNQHLIPTSTTVTNVTHHHIHHQDVLAGSPTPTNTVPVATRQQLQQHLLPQQQQQQHRFRQHVMTAHTGQGNGSEVRKEWETVGIA
ncbi:hypothetical protein Pmani_025352 [Petrolisthes manimaculis]|uniref:Nephrin n=1 Tax=Petrolisthes manimaculis TaxID=1843537 RepID=A0AAE1P6B2_9EUCA|nr:hypothetical protein Pmani_025352 [Petrolisthes manimaculis]